MQRRLGSVRGGRAKGATRNVAQMAAAAQHRMPGYVNILKALAAYRKACSDGSIRVKPADAFNVDKLPWLFANTDDQDSEQDTLPL